MKKNLVIFLAVLSLFLIGQYAFSSTTTDGNSIITGTLAATGHTTFEGVTSTGATGTGKLVYDGSPALTTPTGIVAGSNSEYQYRNGTAFGAVSNSGPVTTTWTIKNGAILNNFSGARTEMYVPQNSSINLRAIVNSVSAPPYSVIATIACAMQDQSTVISTQICGLSLSDGTKYETCGVQTAASVTSQMRCDTWASVTSSSTTVAGPTANLVSPAYFTLKVSDNSTTRVWAYYSNGSFVTILSEATATFVTPNVTGPFGLATNAATTSLDLSAGVAYWCVAAATSCAGN